MAELHARNIVEYLEDAYPEKPLLGITPAGCAATGKRGFDGRCALWSFSGAFAASASVLRRFKTGARMDGRPNLDVSTYGPKI